MKSFDVNNVSFFVSCVGAYDDSGVGTGGFVCVHQGNPIIIDKIDCTGLFYKNDTAYRFIRSRRSVVGYDLNGIKSIVRLDNVKDGHDIMVTERGYICVSTGKNEICWCDSFGNLTRTWKANGENDAWHLNCLEMVDNGLYASAFGEFKEHRDWNGHSLGTGFILNVETGEKVAMGLSGPHNPRFIGGQWVVCDSHISALTFVESPNRLRKIQLDGFTRGFAYDEDYFYVGESANRKSEAIKDYSHIAIIDRKTEQIVERIRIPFPEIYEIIIVSGMAADFTRSNLSMFQMDKTQERIIELENQVQRGLEEVEVLRIKLEKVQGRIVNRIWDKLVG